MRIEDRAAAKMKKKAEMIKYTRDRVKLSACIDEWEKLSAARRKNEGFSYGKALAASAPIFAAKAALGDLPRKTLEGHIQSTGEAKLRGVKPHKLRTSLSKSFRGKGLRTALIGGGVGVLTAPIFLRGVQLASGGGKRKTAAWSPEKKRKAKGLAMIGGAGSVYAAGKGYGEGIGLGKQVGLKGRALRRKGLAYSIGRTTWKLPAAIALGAAIASGRKKGKKGSGASKYLAPAAIGAGVGGGMAMSSEALDRGLKAGKGRRLSTFRKALTTRTGLRRLVPAGKAGLIGGAAGTALTAAIVDKALKKMK